MSEKPRSGIYGNEQVYSSYEELKKSVDSFIPDHIVGLHIGGSASMARAKAKKLVSQAKTLESMIKAVCVGRK